MISIAMATYNGETYLREQLDSILAQTVTDLEIVIGDDNSTDSTRAILEYYAKKDSRIHYFVNSKNIGFKDNFERIIKRCHGDYIALCDQDDIWESKHIEILLNNIGECSLSCGNALIVNSNNQSLGKLLNTECRLYSIPNDSKKLLYKIFFSWNSFQGTSMLMPTSFAKQCLPIPKEATYHDSWFAICACLNNGIAYTFTPITRYRRHGNNVTHEETTQQKNWTYYLCKTINVILRNESFYTDRFGYVTATYNRFGFTNKDFVHIYNYMKSLQDGKSNIKELFHLWKNYPYISTTNSRKHFLRSWFVWTHWKPIVQNSLTQHT